jgi:hypothetical protein
MPDAPQGVDRIESAAQITLVVTRGAEQDASRAAEVEEVPISRLDTTKEVDITEVRESSLKATGYSITAISYSGTMMFKGSTLTRLFRGETTSLNDILYDESGAPVPVSISITHDINGEGETYTTVLVNSESYQVRSGEVTETAFDWMAMNRSTDNADLAGAR